MDITRHWRLKTTRSHPLATRCPATGRVTLAQQRGVTSRHDRLRYDFESVPVSRSYTLTDQLAEAAD